MERACYKCFLHISPWYPFATMIVLLLVLAEVVWVLYGIGEAVYLRALTGAFPDETRSIPTIGTAVSLAFLAFQIGYMKFIVPTGRRLNPWAKQMIVREHIDNMSPLMRRTVAILLEARDELLVESGDREGR